MPPICQQKAHMKNHLDFECNLKKNVIIEGWHFRNNFHWLKKNLSVNFAWKVLTSLLVLLKFWPAPGCTHNLADFSLVRLYAKNALYTDADYLQN